MTPIEPGLEKTIYKMIKKQTGQKIDPFAAFYASLKTDMGVLPEIPVNILLSISEHDLWLIDSDSVQQLPLRYLSPHFPPPYEYIHPGLHKYLIPQEFEFTFLPTEKYIRIRPIEASKQVNEFAIWLTEVAKQDQLNWWK